MSGISSWKYLCYKNYYLFPHSCPISRARGYRRRLVFPISTLLFLTRRHEVLITFNTGEESVDHAKRNMHGWRARAVGPLMKHGPHTIWVQFSLRVTHWSVLLLTQSRHIISGQKLPFDKKCRRFPWYNFEAASFASEQLCMRTVPKHPWVSGGQGGMFYEWRVVGPRSRREAHQVIHVLQSATDVTNFGVENLRLIFRET